MSFRQNPSSKVQYLDKNDEKTFSRCFGGKILEPIGISFLNIQSTYQRSEWDHFWSWPEILLPSKSKFVGFLNMKMTHFFEITRARTIFSDKIQSIQNFRKKWLQLVTWPRMSILIKNALFWSFGGINGSKNGSIFDKVKGLPCRFYRFWPLFKTWPRMHIKSTFLNHL